MGFLQAAAQLVLSVNILFLLLLGFSLVFSQPGLGTRIVMLGTLIPVVGGLLGSLIIIHTGWDPL